MRTILIYPCLLVLMASGTGCETFKKNSVTGRLWDDTPAAGFCEPAEPVNLQLYRNPTNGEFLVCYDAWKKDGPHRQAYYLLQNQHRIAAGKKQKFERLELTNSLAPVPVFTTEQPGEKTGIYASINKGERSFTLSQPGISPQDISLPVYYDHFGATSRALLTLPAATLDASVGALVVVGVAVSSMRGMKN